MALETISASAPATAFAETQWSLVIHARGTNGERAAAALNQLCQQYWGPLYRFVRWRGYDAVEAQDLTQGFFLHCIECECFQSVDRSKGRFRAFLLACLKNFLENERARADAVKRGRNYRFISLTEESECGLADESRQNGPPEALFDREWAKTIVKNAVSQLRDEYAHAGKTAVFDLLLPYLCGDRAGQSYAVLAVSLHMSEAALKMAVVRLRRRFGSLVRSQVAQTVARPSDLEDELRHLFAALSS